jgi:CelD/BcsL family acetyltransferase involved in cellulose biosynthesis
LHNSASQQVIQWDAQVERDPQRFASLRAEWEDLPQTVSPLLGHVWQCAAAEQLHAQQTLSVLVLRQAGRISAAAPLAVTSIAGVRRWQLLGVAMLMEPAGLLYRDAAAAEKLAGGLLAMRKPLVLQRVSPNDVAAEAFAARAPRLGWLFKRPASAAPYVSITTDWNSYLATLSGRRRYDYRRNRKRLVAAGDVHVAHEIATAVTATRLLQRLIAVENASWKSANGSSLQAKPALRSFFDSVVAGWAAGGSVRCSFLSLDGRDVAAVLWLVHCERAWVLKIGYDAHWAEASPGIQLLWDVLQAAFEMRLRSFEFLGSDEPWLAIWATDKRPYHTWVFYPHTPSGGLALAMDAAAAFGRKLGALLHRLAGAMRVRAGN